MPAHAKQTAEVGALMAGRVSGTSPISLVEDCVKCGKDAAHGRRINTTQHFSPRWVLLGLLAGLIPLIPLYFVERKTLRLSYSLCPECAGAARREKWIAAGAWLMVAASVLVSIGLNDAWVLIASGVLFVAAVVASVLTNSPVIVNGYEDGVFTVKGASQEFLASRGNPAA